jgi:ABC-type transport system involved in multi-copper enzyme maturation permease subunit
MDKISYFIYLWRTHRGLLIFGFTFLAFIQFLIITIMSSVDYVPVIEAIINQLPPRLQMLFNQEFISRLSINGAVAFGFNHPLVLSILSIIAIIIPSRHIAGEIEAGTLELLLSSPIKRFNFLFLFLGSACLFLFIIILGGWIGSVASLFFYKKISFGLIQKISNITLNLWLLYVLIIGYSTLISVFGKETGKVGIISAAITLIFYFFHFLSSVWESVEFVKPYNIFTYYQPQKLMFGERSVLLNVTILIVLIFACVTLALKKFQHRDIP